MVSKKKKYLKIRRLSSIQFKKESGDNSEEATPVPISNTVVKLLSADDTWGVTLWEIRTSPLFL